MESAYIRSIHRLLPRHIYAWKISDRFTSGIPDAYYSGEDDMWIEYKFAKHLPKRHKPALSKLQENWLRARHEQGRKVFVIVATPEGAVIYDNLKWEAQQATDAMQKLTKRQLAEWITEEVTHVR